MRSDRERLEDILEAIELIEKRAPHTQEALERDELLQVWVLHHLQIIGEAARALSPEFRMQHAGINWPQMLGMRNVLVHHYFEIDLPIVWSVVAHDLPALKSRIGAILRELPPPHR